MMKCKVSKYVIAMALVMCNTIPLTIAPAMAADCQALSVSTVDVHVNNGTDSISPRYTTLRKFATELTIDKNGLATCQGDANTQSGYTCNATLELQQKNGSSWETIAEWTSSGRTNEFNQSRLVKSGYSYRLKLTAEVSNSSGTLIESPVTYSGIAAY